MRILTLLLLVVVSTSCMTPENWPPEDHKRNMLQCRISCDKMMKGYEPLTGECMCFKKHPKLGDE